MKFKKIKFWIGPIILLITFVFSHYQQNLYEYLDYVTNTYSIGFKILEVNDDAGIHFKHHMFKVDPSFENVKNWITSMGSGVTVFDINNDGYMAILFNQSAANELPALFINDHHGGFINKAKAYGLTDEITRFTQSRFIAFDCNNDGFPDLLLLTNPPKLYLNDNGKKFIDITKESGLPSNLETTPMIAGNAFDYDKDGNLDLIFGSYMSNNLLKNTGKTTGIIPDNFNDSANAAPVFLFKGDGKCHFKNVSFLLPKSLNKRGWFLDFGIMDLFGKGNQDMWIATDYGLSTPLEFINSDTGWIDHSNDIKNLSKARSSMSVSFSDFAHQMKNSILVTNIFSYNEKVFGNLFWEYQNDKNEFIEYANELNVNNCGWPWGSQFVDLNNDSWDDLVIVNGMYGDHSNKPAYWYNLSILDSSGRNFMGDYKNWPSDKNFNLDSNQKDCIFLNQKGKRPFLNVSKYFKEFDKDNQNGRAIAIIDRNNNGNFSLAVSNQGGDAKIYDVIPTEKFMWVGLYLKTSNHNSFSVGAKIFWEFADGDHSFKEMRSITGYMSQNDPRFRLAIPKNKTLKSLRIKWLDGFEQNLDLSKLRLNSYNDIIRVLP